jgi:hypothetical protein
MMSRPGKIACGRVMFPYHRNLSFGGFALQGFP